MVRKNGNTTVAKTIFAWSIAIMHGQAGIKEKIIEMAHNSSGVRDTGRVLNISKDTVCSVLKNCRKKPLFSNTQRII
jgi:transposase-like protein